MTLGLLNSFSYLPFNRLLEMLESQRNNTPTALQFYIM